MNEALTSPGALWRATTFADRALCAFLLAGSLAAALGFRAPSAPAGRAVVVVGRAAIAEMQLDVDASQTFTGRLGPITVSTRGGAVAVTASTCPHRVCVAMGWKHRTGEVIACVPNELLVRVEGGVPSDGAPDAIAR